MSDEVKKDHGVVFKTIKFRNFMSFGNVWTEVNLCDPGTTFIVGENLDSGGSSGAGKSTLINAISYCLFDKIPSGVSKDRLINRTNDKKNTLMEVVLDFTVGIESYQIRRFRGNQTGVQLFHNGVDITPSSVNRGEDSFNAKIEDIVGFSYNLFSLIILFNGNSRAFLDESVNSQRTLTEELFKITTLSKKAVALKGMIKETEKSIEMQKLVIQQQQKQNETYKKHVSDAVERVERWEATHATEIANVKAQIERAASINFDVEEQIFEELTRLELQNTEITAKIKNIDILIQSKKKEQPSERSQLALAKSDLAKKKADKTKLADEISHLKDAKCPYCLQQYEDAPSKINEIESKISELSEQIQLLETTVVSLQSDIDKFTVDQERALSELEAQKKTEIETSTNLTNEINNYKLSLSFKTLHALNEAKNSASVLQDKLNRLESEENPHVEALTILTNEGEIEINDEGLNATISLLDHQQFLLKLLVDKNSFIRKAIISKTIPFLNKRIAFYSEKLNLPHIVLFQPEMTCQITQYGRELDHGNLSNGEKKKLNLSLCLAFRDVLTYLHSKVNVLFTDEVDGGSISGYDVDSMIGMIKHKAWDDDISIFIISHRPEFDGRCDRNLVIRKDGGFSTLIPQPE